MSYAILLLLTDEPLTGYDIGVQQSRPVEHLAKSDPVDQLVRAC